MIYLGIANVFRLIDDLIGQIKSANELLVPFSEDMDTCDPLYSKMQFYLDSYLS